MQLTFLGTRGEIEARNTRHHRHTSTLVIYHRRSVMLDCGADWAEDVYHIRPNAIVITHSHPDHAWGLKNGAPCPVYATADAWMDMSDYPISVRHTIEPRSPLRIEGIQFEAFTVEHSTRSPAVGYRITAGRVSVFYAPDLVYIHEREPALRGIRLYIGDGATPARSFVRKREDRLIGHTPIRTQLTWCGKMGVPEVLITHCGSQIVKGDEEQIAAQLHEWGEERGVIASIAYDGMERTLR
ncbi:MAG: MBL fold metallo-hydrolase [Chloroflexota bacterium]